MAHSVICTCVRNRVILHHSPVETWADATNNYGHVRVFGRLPNPDVPIPNGIDFLDDESPSSTSSRRLQ
jgi:hypothetical protein